MLLGLPTLGHVTKYKNYFVIQCNQKIPKAPHKYNKERVGIN